MLITLTPPSGRRYRQADANQRTHRLASVPRIL